ncbi:MAG: erythrose-4-phosphate dehydrogenase [Zoogloeaceae bacterium]|jgi:glyceraldehyde 3-phosphate dehydrogenase/D-erythrose 4-phosphate dehydrogenase|nr:erythrose-4-phosphate dehydrogenase [Zoogloeaceae bacterium]
MPSTSPVRLAINGYGRIGRCFLRALHEAGLTEEFRIAAINEPADLASMAYLTRFDSTHGRFAGNVTVDEASGAILIDGRAITIRHAQTPEAVDWRALDVDLVIECSGRYGSRAELSRFLAAGAPRLLVSHPANSAADVDATVVYGVNQQDLTGHERIVSGASCTTNAVVPILDLLDRAWGVEEALLTTLHSVMNDQPLIDGYHHADLRRTRSAMQSIIPVSTGLARGVERLLPRLAGKVRAKAIRVPTTNVSAIDLTVALARPVDADALRAALVMATATDGPFANLVAWSEETHASIDFNHDPHSAILDGSQIHLSGSRLVNLLIWFDNEWGFANRMLDILRHWRFRWQHARRDRRMA